jgi:hypothetical protein
METRRLRRSHLSRGNLPNAIKSRHFHLSLNFPELLHWN